MSRNRGFGLSPSLARCMRRRGLSEAEARRKHGLEAEAKALRRDLRELAFA